MSDAASHVPMGAGREFDHIRALLQEWGPLAQGIGDDAAVLDAPRDQKLVASTDASVEGVHFRRQWLAPDEIGYRAVTAALSDLAAMAASPCGILVALALPQAWDKQLRELARGLGRAAGSARCAIVGGNMTRASELSITTTVLGSVPHPVGRTGARAGDVIYVTGRLGGPGRALAAWLRGDRPEAGDRARFASPVARIDEARWLAECGARALIDISDGLAADAAHLAAASGVSLELDPALVPRVAGASADEAIASGEEYELIVALPPEEAIDRQGFDQRFGIPLTPIGTVVAAAQAAPVRWRGRRVDSPGGHDHFS